MGIIQFGIPKELSIFFRDKLNVSNFVETGTYLGGTSIWASKNFNTVYTVENSKIIYKNTSKKLLPYKNIKMSYGNSRVFLKKIIKELSGPTLFWLDAHWSGGETYGGNDECPILDEIKTIKTLKNKFIVLIDDARLFLSPPPPPHKHTSWPNISSILNELGSDRYNVVLDDVIVSVPKQNKDEFVAFLQGPYCDFLNNRDTPVNLILNGMNMVFINTVLSILRLFKIR